MPELHEIEESVGPKKPIRRTSFKSRKMMGSTTYVGKDRIKPVHFCVTFVTAGMIIAPSVPCATAV